MDEAGSGEAQRGGQSAGVQNGWIGDRNLLKQTLDTRVDFVAGRFAKAQEPHQASDWVGRIAVCERVRDDHAIRPSLVRQEGVHASLQQIRDSATAGCTRIDVQENALLKGGYAMPDVWRNDESVPGSFGSIPVENAQVLSRECLNRVVAMQRVVAGDPDKGGPSLPKSGRAGPWTGPRIPSRSASHRSGKAMGNFVQRGHAGSKFSDRFPMALELAVGKITHGQIGDAAERRPGDLRAYVRLTSVGGD